MRRCATVLCLLAAAGCGDDGGDGGPADRLQGNWYLESDEYVCGLGVSFEGDYIEFRDVCEFDGGNLGAEVHGGTFTATDTRVEWEIMAGTCPPERALESESASYKLLEGDRLQLVLPGELLVFERVRPGETASGSVELGCYDDEGFFDPREVENY